MTGKHAFVFFAFGILAGAAFGSYVALWMCR